MLVRLLLVLGPLSVLAGVLPFLEGLVEAGVFLVALTLAVPLTLITIAVAWFAHRPLIGTALIVAGLPSSFWSGAYPAVRRAGRSRLPTDGQPCALVLPCLGSSERGGRIARGVVPLARP
jgi:hypothetical protein